MACVALVCSAWAYRSWCFPYGWSHCCDKALALVLYQYAEDHGGAYPAGEATPEASLSLLYPDYVDANMLRGKTVPLEIVRSILLRGDKLAPDTCGWHYVPGLTRDDDSRLAIIWGKVPLGHNGQRTTDGGQSVIRVGGITEYIPGDKWSAFLEQQEQLLAERKRKLVSDEE